MTTLQSILSDSDLKSEIMDKLNSGTFPYSPHTGLRIRDIRELVGRAEELPFGALYETEAIVREFGRPVLFVQDDDFVAPQSEVIARRMEANRLGIKAAIQAIGRVEVLNHPGYDWLGTGWLVRPNIIATNRHVASEFTTRSGNRFTFRQNFLGQSMSAKMDFKEEHLRSTAKEFVITQVLHVEDDSGPDIAFLRIEAQNQIGINLAQPIPLAPTVRTGEEVCVIGYPAWDGRRNEPDVMTRIFGGVYDVKRIAPGVVSSLDGDRFTHDCSTLGGNSGSCVFAYGSNTAVGIHFAGRYGIANYAVSASTINTKLQQLGE